MNGHVTKEGITLDLEAMTTGGPRRGDQLRRGDGHPEGTRPVPGSRVVRAEGARDPRGGAPGARVRDAQLPGLVVERRALDHARAGDAAAHLERGPRGGRGNRGGRPADALPQAGPLPGRRGDRLPVAAGRGAPPHAAPERLLEQRPRLRRGAQHERPAGGGRPARPPAAGGRGCCSSSTSPTRRDRSPSSRLPCARARPRAGREASGVRQPILLEASDDGASFRRVAEIATEGGDDVTLATADFPPVTARYFRLSTATATSYSQLRLAAAPRLRGLEEAHQRPVQRAGAAATSPIPGRTSSRSTG